MLKFRPQVVVGRARSRPLTLHGKNKLHECARYNGKISPLHDCKRCTRLSAVSEHGGSATSRDNCAGEETQIEYPKIRRRPYAAAKTVLGVDYSATTTGLAAMKSPALFVDGARKIVEVAKQHLCDSIVVGVPLTPKQDLWDANSDSRTGRRCRNFAHTLAMVARSDKLNVFIVSERFSTQQAEQDFFSHKKKRKSIKKQVDSAAAAIILDRFFQDKGGAVHMKPKYGLRDHAQQ